MNLDFLNTDKIKKTVFTIVLFILSAALCACSHNNSNELNKQISGGKKAETSKSEDITLDKANISKIPDEVVNNGKVIDKGKYYKIILSGENSYYIIYDYGGNIKKYDGPFKNSIPHINMINDDLLKFTMQSGTGIATQWGFYYNIKEDRLSENFQSIYDENNGRVVFRESFEKIVVSDIFDKTLYYKEFASYKYPLSSVADPIISVHFIDDGTKFEVNYLTGDENSIVKEVFTLD